MGNGARRVQSIRERSQDSAVTRRKRASSAIAFAPDRRLESATELATLQSYAGAPDPSALQMTATSPYRCAGARVAEREERVPGSLKEVESPSAMADLAFRPGIDREEDGSVVCDFVGELDVRLQFDHVDELGF